MAPLDYVRLGKMQTALHLIYEFQKGVRSLVLCTLCPTCAAIIKERLDELGIEYLTRELGNRNVNLFFGERACLDAVSEFIGKPLNRLTPEEDFMLGAMLGYDITQQCRRFCDRKAKLQSVGLETGKVCC